ncbi:hypothetical protein ES319_D13G121900v1 [Gossypium barbadense]|uniref:CHHC U11-48K-type domain-containing protein n=1 Tax=Gossypium barbadense TaxID=3634 RepID=A0A5J5NL29_GOSBA|nr:hypothetical protein ES319_D13G121900v1 [Gossypium barbadense]KAB1994798.1 hypothetical protein ES319_D13G121900v1 [Gossypium barbadense]
MNPSPIQPFLPSQNPNPNFPLPPLSQNPNPVCPPSLSAALCSLTSLVSLSHRTLDSHSTLTTSLNSGLVTCPSNPNHLLPPGSLFSHFLHCPSPQTIDLHPPNYRNTLKSALHLHPQDSIFQGASRLLLFPMEEKVIDSLNLGQESQSLVTNGVEEIKLEEPTEQSNEPVKTVDGSIGAGTILVSQVAAAVAALHERCFLEGKIKHLQASRPPSRYERMAEHAYVSERADAERKKRPNYRPIIDHDGLPRQASSNEETNRTKTREEILAEERDYKRRRMSYRGKKLKRTKLEVMRDIIEEYTEEIKKAGGIGCFVKGAEEERRLSSESPVPYDHAVNAGEHRKGTTDISEAVSGSPNHYGRRSHNDQHSRSSRFENYSRNNFEQSRRHRDLEDQRRRIGEEKHREDHSRTSRHRSHGGSDGRRSHRRERDDVEPTRATHYERGSRSSISKYRDYKSSYSVSNSSDDSHEKKNDLKLDSRDQNRRSSYENQTSGSRAQNGFDDRYNPLESEDMYDDVLGGKYVRPD